MNIGVFLLRIVQGALIGGGAILPGISGGVLSVLFGIYHPLMEVLTTPFKAIKRHWKLFIPVAIGAAIGFVLFARLVTVLLGDNANTGVCLFVGLVIGTLPSLWKEAGSQKRTSGSWISLAVSFAALLGILLILGGGSSLNITPDWKWFFFCGVVWGLSLIVPGMSSSSILMFMGLYVPMSEGISALNMGVVLPLMAGIVTSAVLLARAVRWLFDNHHSIASHAIIGLVLASTVMIIPTSYAGFGEVVLCILCAAVGYAIAWGMDVWGEKLGK